MSEIISQSVTGTQSVLPVERGQFASDPSGLGGNISGVGIKVRHETFEQAQEATKGLSDYFIDAALSEELSVGGRWVGIKGYLDTVEATSRDRQVTGSPERIAGLYIRTTEMLTRNLKVSVVRDSDTEKANARREQIKRSKELYLSRLGSEAPRAASEIADWCEGINNSFPLTAVEYHGFEVDGTDILDASKGGLLGVLPNFEIQRQLGGTFVMAYSDKRVHDKAAGREAALDKRIYLNPDMEATPEIFEQLLHSANEAGISIKLKMFQRASELASIYKSRARSDSHEIGGLRGDGIVMYTESKDANDVLAMVLALAKDNPDLFKGRKTSRIPQNVAEGIAAGDEPSQQARGVSLTSHRKRILSYVTDKTRQSGKRGQEARDFYRDLFRRTAVANRVNPDNMAFNIKS